MKLFRQEVGSGFPLIILHGLFGASGNWRTLSRKVFSNAYRTIAVDLRNHGRSPHSSTFDYESMAADVVGVLDEEGLSTAHVLGHSMGGKVAMRMALDHPERVDHLIVADVAPRAYPPRHTYIFEAFHAVDPGTYESREDLDTAMAEHIPNTAVRQFLLKNLERTDDGYRWKMNLDAIHDAYDSVSGDITSSRPFNGSALFIAGGASDYVSEKDLSDILTLFPAAVLETIPGAGHWLHAEQPDRFSGLVMDFLAS